jgi:hypothetical protein
VNRLAEKFDFISVSPRFGDHDFRLQMAGKQEGAAIRNGRANPPCDVHSVQAGHIKIRDKDIWTPRPGQTETRNASARADSLEAGQFQDDPQRFRYYGIIIDDKNTGPTDRAMIFHQTGGEAEAVLALMKISERFHHPGCSRRPLPTWWRVVNGAPTLRRDNNGQTSQFDGRAMQVPRDGTKASGSPKKRSSHLRISCELQSYSVRNSCRDSASATNLSSPRSELFLPEMT